MQSRRSFFTCAFVVVLLFSFGAIVCVRPVRAAYSVRIQAWDNLYAWQVMPIYMDNANTGFSTPHTFDGLTGIHNFTASYIDPQNGLFVNWSSGLTNQILTVSSGGTFTAQYYQVYSVTIWAWDALDPVGWIVEPITSDGSPTTYSTPHTFTVLGGHTFSVPPTDSAGHPFFNWNTGQTSNTITISSEGTYTARYAPPLSVIVSPSIVTMNVGQTQNFSATLSGGSGNYSHCQWYVNGAAQSGAVQSIFPFTPGSVGSYSVTATVSDSLGVTSAESSPTVVTVNPALTASVTPSSLTVDWGIDAMFSASVSGGTSPYSYQWYVGGSAVSGATNSSYLFLSPAFFPNSNRNTTLFCRVTDSASIPNIAQSNVVPITIYPELMPPSSISASSTFLEQGQSITLTAIGVSGGLPPYTYWWNQMTPGASQWSNIAGATSSTCVFTTSTATATGVWRFISGVMDNTWLGAVVGSASSIANITVLAGPSVSVSPASVKMDVGQSKLFTAIPAAGSGAYTSYQWFVNGVAQSGSTGSTFTYSPVSTGSPAIAVTVTDSVGVTSTQSSAASVTVNPMLVAPTVASSPSNLTQGQSSSLTATPITTGTSPYTYQWFSMPPGVSSYSPMSGASSTTYSFATSNSTSTGTWTFMLQVTDNTGAAVSNTATVTVGASIPEFSYSIMLAALLMALSVVAAVTNRKSRR